MANPNPNDFPPLLPGSIPPSNSTSIPPDGGLCPDVVTQIVLERHASPLGENLRASKKEVSETRQQSPIGPSGLDRGNVPKPVTYAYAVSSASENVVSGTGLNGMEDFVLLEEDCIVDDSGPYPSIEFNGHSFSTTASFPTEVIVWVRIPGLPYRYYSKALFRRIAAVIGKVIKIDYKTREGERGRFARLAVLVDLTCPLIPCLKIDGALQSLEYEGLQNICFHCGTYGHTKDSCLALVKAVESEQTRPKVSGPSDDVVFGPWMITDTQRQRPRKDIRPAVGVVTTQNVAQGSRFMVLEKEVADQGDRMEVPQDGETLGGLNGTAREDQLGLMAADGPIIRDVTSEVGQIPLVSHVAVNNVTGTHSALVIHDGRQLKHSGGGALRVAGSSKKGLKVNRGKDLWVSTLSSLSEYVQSIGKDPGLRGDGGQTPSSNFPIIIPDDRPFEPGDNRSNSNPGCLEDDMEVIEEEVETLSQ
ncbi:hypothetical protein GQ457_02G030340 [Hibiscus cannabinus]